MGIVLHIIFIIQYIIIFYIGINVIYLLIYAIAGLFNHKITKDTSSENKRYIIFIPAYKEDEVIIDVVTEALKQNYPKELYDICVIADKMKDETIAKLKSFDIITMVVNFESSTKSKALNYALESIPDNKYDFSIVLDADNIMEEDFLSKISECKIDSLHAVQGHRTAKNKDSAFAILDAVSEEINNHIFRKGHRVLGFSSALIGSGAAIDFNIFKEIMSTINAIGGFDKELEFKLAKRNIKIEYLSSALVYDEKIQNSESFSNQRKRWLSAQFHYAFKFLPDASLHLLLKRNINYFDKVLQQFFLPRVLLLGVTFLLVCISILYNPFILSCIWGGIFALIIIILCISIPGYLYNTKFLYALFSVPKAFLLFFLLLFKIKGANKKFIHTKHSSTKLK